MKNYFKIIHKVKKFQESGVIDLEFPNMLPEVEVTAPVLTARTGNNSGLTPEQQAKLRAIEADSDAMEDADNQKELDAISTQTSPTDILKVIEKGDEIAEKYGKSDAGTGGGSGKKGLTPKQADIMGKVADAGRHAISAVSDNLLQGKNFDAQSQAIDGVADAAAEFASSFGPWGKVAALGITALNEGTKMFGQTVSGFDVKVDNSGYAQSMMSQESKSNRAWVGKKKIDQQLNARNAKLQMALNAQDISEDIKFEQTARANSIDNIIKNNQIALNGGLSTSILAAKRGGKLDRLKNYKPVLKAENGAKLKDIEVSEEASVIPEGALHKNKHNLDLEGITLKGIPVITVDEDADTFMEIKDQEDSVVIHAEVEKEEVIFSKELTDFVEDKRKEWHESNSNDILEEVGKRVTKELLFNTNDNAELIDTLR